MTDNAIIHLRPRQQPQTAPVLLRVGQAAERLGVSKSTMERWLRRGLIPHVYLPGNMLRIPAAELDSWWRDRLQEAH